MPDPNMKVPSTIGEWDIEIAARSGDELQRYLYALKTLQGWTAFDQAFKWTRIFVLIQSIEFEMERELKRREAKG